MCRNGRAFVEALFGAASVGADVVLINTEFRTDALAAALDAHDITTVVCEPEFDERVSAADESIAVLHPAAVDETRPGAARPQVAPAGRIILLTSGTTGKPKGVPRAPRMSTGVVGIGLTILDRTRLRAGLRNALAVPMFHGLGLGMLILTVGLGGTVLTHRRFDAGGRAGASVAAPRRRDDRRPDHAVAHPGPARHRPGTKPAAGAENGDVQR